MAGDSDLRAALRVAKGVEVGAHVTATRAAKARRATKVALVAATRRRTDAAGGPADAPLLTLPEGALGAAADAVVAAVPKVEHAVAVPRPGGLVPVEVLGHAP